MSQEVILEQLTNLRKINNNWYSVKEIEKHLINNKIILPYTLLWEKLHKLAAFRFIEVKKDSVLSNRILFRGIIYNDNK
jgi:hypothetical protein